jgi:nitrite reductase/ring-hydroxylating ferredoxin subunit
VAFVRVAGTEEIPVGHAKLVEKDGITVAVFNAGGRRFYACGALCPHEDGPLADGWLEGDAAICPWHGFDYELATGRCRADPDLAIPVYPVRVVGNSVEVDVP